MFKKLFFSVILSMVFMASFCQSASANNPFEKHPGEFGVELFGIKLGMAYDDKAIYQRAVKFFDNSLEIGNYFVFKHKENLDIILRLCRLDWDNVEGDFEEGVDEPYYHVIVLPGVYGQVLNQKVNDSFPQDEAFLMSDILEKMKGCGYSLKAKRYFVGSYDNLNKAKFSVEAYTYRVARISFNSKQVGAGSLNSIEFVKATLKKLNLFDEDKLEFGGDYIIYKDSKIGYQLKFVELKDGSVNVDYSAVEIFDGLKF